MDTIITTYLPPNYRLITGHCVPTFTQPKRVLANNLGEIQMLDKFIQTKVSITWFQWRKIGGRAAKSPLRHCMVWYKVCTLDTI